MSDKQAGFFIDGWYMFDNFSAVSIMYKNNYYPTVEHAFQSCKYHVTAPDIAEKIRLMTSPAEVFLFTRDEHVKSLRDPDWDKKKLAVMEELIRLKYDQHEIVRNALRDSGDMQIVEMNDNDNFWGWGEDHAGKNHLGKIWMKLRDEKR